MIASMEAVAPAPPVTLSVLARRLRVPVSWLREEAEAGRLPHLKAGRQILFDADTVIGNLRERAAGKAVSHAC